MISTIRGKLANGKTGTLEIVENRIVIKEEKGTFTKRLEESSVIPLIDICLVSKEEMQPPFRSMIRIKIDYQEEGESKEILFFTDDLTSLDEIIGSINTDIERLSEDEARDEAVRKKELESHIHHITLVLLMVDQVFQILVSLNREPNWDTIFLSVSKAESIVGEMKTLGVVAPINIDTKGLASAAKSRKVENIKEEVNAILIVAHRESERLAQYEEPMHFNLELHEVFVKSYMLLWEIYVMEILGKSVEEEKLKILKSTFSSLNRIVPNKITFLTMSEIQELSPRNGVAHQFDRLKFLIQQSLHSLVN